MRRLQLSGTSSFGNLYPSIFLLLLSFPLYYFLLYETPRQHFFQTAGLWGLLFVGYFGLLSGFFLNRKDALSQGEEQTGKRWFWALMAAAIGFRLLAVLALPELSDDYFRFVWDGRLLAHGENPFSKLPSAYLPADYAARGLDEALFSKLNSPDYHTIYPPVCQGIFYVAARIFPNDIYASVLVMKAFFFLAETGSIFLIVRLLRHWKQDVNKVFLYALNPLVVVELCGNLHFECLMIFFLLLSIWLLVKKKWPLAAWAFGLAVSSKLIPLMLLPLLISRIGFWRSIGFGAIAMGVTLLGFLPIFDLATFLHLFESIQLYFQSFEFNASFYYLIRAVGKWVSGYNLIRYMGPCLSLFTFVGILWIAFRRKKQNLASLPESMLAVLLLYLLLATTVHPWYIITLVAFATFTDLRFPYIWSALLILTYSAYRSEAYTESMWLVVIEYILLFVFLFREKANWHQFTKSKT